LSYEPPKGLNMPLFEFLQSDFDVAVEKLSYWLEHAGADTKELRIAMTRAEHLLYVLFHGLLGFNHFYYIVTDAFL
jgi:hypothetical protein